jgi:hypothetical protein
LTLSGYALIFTLSRFIGGLSLFVVSFLLIRYYSDHMMAVLMATILSIFAASGIWNNPLFGWAVNIAPWMNFPVQLLGWLIWCGAIVIFAFPDGTFRPRWMLWLAVLLVPMTFTMAFNIEIFLNPNTWPAPFYLVPNILFIGGALFSVIYRYRRITEPRQKQAMRWYVFSLTLLTTVYFINLFLTDIYYLLAGHPLFQDNPSRLTYVLLNEPIWFACEALFAIGWLFRSFEINF